MKELWNVNYSLIMLVSHILKLGMDQMICYLTEQWLLCSIIFNNGFECPEILSAA